MNIFRQSTSGTVSSFEPVGVILAANDSQARTADLSVAELRDAFVRIGPGQQILARRVVVRDFRLLSFHGISLSLSHSELENSSSTRLRR